MSTSPLHERLERILHPLEFAARADFANLERIQGLESAVRRAKTYAIARSANHQDRLGDGVG